MIAWGPEAYPVACRSSQLTLSSEGTTRMVWASAPPASIPITTNAKHNRTALPENLGTRIMKKFLARWIMYSLPITFLFGWLLMERGNLQSPRGQVSVNMYIEDDGSWQSPEEGDGDLVVTVYRRTLAMPRGVPLWAVTDLRLGASGHSAKGEVVMMTDRHLTDPAHRRAALDALREAGVPFELPDDLETRPVVITRQRPTLEAIIVFGGLGASGLLSWWQTTCNRRS